MRVSETARMLELGGLVVEGRLDQWSFAARLVRVLGLVGATGSGKSSALAVGAGLLPARSGRVLLDGGGRRYTTFQDALLARPGIPH